MSSSPKVPAVPAPAESDAAPVTPRKPSLPKRTLPLGALFGAGSLPPQPAGRAPVSAPPPPAASIVPVPPSAVATVDDQPAPPVDEPAATAEPATGPNVPDLPAGLYADDDPLADLFGDGPSRPTPVGAEGDTATVARLELARTSSHGAAEEINATPRRDPRVDPSGPFAMPAPSPAESGESHWTQAPAATATAPDANVDEIGATMLAMAPPPAQPSPTIDTHDDAPVMHGVTPDAATIQAVPTQPVRSMRAAMLIIALVLISGGVAVMVSLGVLGGSPTAMRQEAQAAAATRSASTATTPAPVAEAAPKPEPTPAPVAEAAPTPEPATEPTSAPVAEAAPAPEPVTAGKDPVATGNALLRASQLDAAAEQFQAALTADPRDHYAMEGLARVAIARGDGQQAVVYAEQIVKRRAKRASYRVLLGQARAAAGDQAGARAAFAEALALEPDNRDAARLLGQ